MENEIRKDVNERLPGYLPTDAYEYLIPFEFSIS